MGFPKLTARDSSRFLLQPASNKEGVLLAKRKVIPSIDEDDEGGGGRGESIN